MQNIFNKKAIRFFLISLSQLTGFSLQAYSEQRPPQYVAISFDGSYNNQRWEDILEFAQEVKDSSPVKFTFFASGVYMLKRMPKPRANMPEEERSFNQGHDDWWNTNRYYKLPKRVSGNKGTQYDKEGFSNIGFGDYNEDIIVRAAFMSKAFKLGHEIGSHANAHVGASTEKWEKEEWNSELKQFRDLIFNYSKNNKISSLNLGTHLSDENERKELISTFNDYKKPFFKQKDVTGFRAPLLETGHDLYETLNKNNFSYDASKVDSDSTKYPRKEKGIWNFPLGYIPVEGTSRSTISMDYNFYYFQSKGVAEKSDKKLRQFEKQMSDSYQNYFDTNYNGTRAPIHIGHHFSGWNKGIYWSALKNFIKNNCGKPEVKCVTYQELEKHMESLSSDQITAYENKNFPALDDQNFIPKIREEATITLEKTQSGFRAQTFDKKPGQTISWLVNNRMVSSNEVLNYFEFSDAANYSIVEVQLKDKNGLVVDQDAAVYKRNLFIRASFGNSNPLEKIGGNIFKEVSEMMDHHCAHRPKKLGSCNPTEQIIQKVIEEDQNSVDRQINDLLFI